MNRIEKLKEFLSEQPNDPFLVHALGMEYLGIGEGQEAERLFRENVFNHPEYVGSYYQLGQLLEQSGDEAAAIETYALGMKAAENAKDRKSLGELRSAWEELTY